MSERGHWIERAEIAEAQLENKDAEIARLKADLAASEEAGAQIEAEHDIEEADALTRENDLAATVRDIERAMLRVTRAVVPPHAVGTTSPERAAECVEHMKQERDALTTRVAELEKLREEDFDMRMRLG